jgi:XTP/dITP diphosphohydrolase
MRLRRPLRRRVQLGDDQAGREGAYVAVDGVPLAQPALALAAKLLSRADRHGVAVPVGPPDLASVATPRADSDEIGDLLLAVVAMARASGVDAEAALRDGARRYAGRVRAAEAANRS